MFVCNGQAMRRPILAAVLILCASALAQNTPVAAKLMSAHVQGSKRYTEAELLAVVPLRTGRTVRPADFKDAADKLTAMGVFQTVGYEYGPAGTGYTVTFKVEDEPKWIKATYGNFLWFTPEELDKAARERVPLYHGELPIDGGMTDSVVEALQQLIAKRGIPGTVRFLHKAKLSGPITGGKFLIEGIDLKITSVNVTGGGPEQNQLQSEASARLLDNNFEQDETNAVAELNLLRVAQRDGYITAKVGEVEARLTDPDVQHPAVSVTVPVLVGEQYKLADIVISGNSAFSADQIRKQIKAKNGAVINDVQIHDDLDEVKKLYGTRGYMMAQPAIAPDTNESARTAVYRLQIKEGEQFHMGKLQITGVNPDGSAKLQSLWKLKSGEPYDSEYVREYLKQVNPLIPRAANMKIMSNVNREARTVDVTLQFSPRQVAQ
jgi:outer membrane protein assembly factor BamA